MLPPQCILRASRTALRPAARFSSTTALVRTEDRSSATNTLPYFVHRSRTRNLPVYLEAKAGGNKLQTRIRKIEGDINALCEQMQEALQLEQKEIHINQLTKHIIIKGWRKPQVVRFLEDKMF